MTFSYREVQMVIANFEATHLAARSLWTMFLASRYLMPAATCPHISTSLTYNTASVASEASPRLRRTVQRSPWDECSKTAWLLDPKKKMGTHLMDLRRWQLYS